MIHKYNEAEIIKLAQAHANKIHIREHFIVIPIQYEEDHFLPFAMVEFEPKKFVDISESGSKRVFYKWVFKSIKK